MKFKKPETVILTSYHHTGSGYDFNPGEMLTLVDGKRYYYPQPVGSAPYILAESIGQVRYKAFEPFPEAVVLTADFTSSANILFKAGELLYLGNTGYYRTKHGACDFNEAFIPWNNLDKAQPFLIEKGTRNAFVIKEIEPPPERIRLTATYVSPAGHPFFAGEMLGMMNGEYCRFEDPTITLDDLDQVQHETKPWSEYLPESVTIRTDFRCTRGIFYKAGEVFHLESPSLTWRPVYVLDQDAIDGAVLSWEELCRAQPWLTEKTPQDDPISQDPISQDPTINAIEKTMRSMF